MKKITWIAVLLIGLLILILVNRSESNLPSASHTSPSIETQVPEEPEETTDESMGSPNTGRKARERNRSRAGAQMQSVALAGLVVDAATGDPIAGATVTQRLRNNKSFDVLTDSKGIYRFLPREDGDHHLIARADGYQQELRKFRPGTREGPDFSLEALDGRMLGRIVDSKKQPISGAEIMDSFLYKPLIAVSDDNGFFEAPVLSDTPIALSIQADGFALWYHTQKLPPGEHNMGDITLLRLRHFSGRTVDSSEQPVPHATVELLRHRPQAELVKTESDEDGFFELAGLKPDRYWLYAWNRQLGSRISELNLTDEQEHIQLGNIVLKPGPVEGLVHDEQGNPIAGAMVWLTASTNDTDVPTKMYGPTVKTDGNGSFTLPPLPAGQNFGLWVKATNFLPGFLDNLIAPIKEPVIVLKSPRVLAGRIIDVDGKLVPKARLQLIPINPLTRPGKPKHVTGGVFRFEGLQRGSYRLIAYASRRVQKNIQPLILEDEDLDIDIVLEPATRIRGLVTDPEGLPLDSVYVSVKNQDGVFESGISNQDGAYDIIDAPPGPGVLTARHDGYQTVVREVDLDVTDNRIDLQMKKPREPKKTGTISGRVVKPDGSPAGHCLIAYNNERNNSSHGGTRTSDSLGRWKFENQRRGHVSLTAYNKNYGYGTLEFEFNGQNGEDQVINLQEGITVGGNLVGLEPERSAWVVIKAEGQWRADHKISVFPDGTWRAGNLYPGEWMFTAREGESRTATAKITLVEGDGSAALDLVFENSFELNGRVLLEGEPLQGIRVRLKDVEGNTLSRTIPGTGGFRFTNLAPGHYELFVGDSKDRDLNLVRDTSIDVELDLHRVSGKVVDQTGQPIAGAQVEMSHKPVITSGDGRFEVGELSSGIGSLNVYKNGYRSYYRKLDSSAILEGQPQEVVLEEAFQLLMRIFEPDGSLADEIGYVLFHDLGSSQSSMRIGDDGLFRWRNLAKKEYDVMLEDGDLVAYVAGITPSEDIMEITLGRAARLTVKYPDYPLIRPYRFTVLSEDGSRFRISPINDETSCTWFAIPAGRWTIRYAHEDLTWETNVVLQPGERATVEM